MATTATNPVDWKLIWAQRGFRYFFLAMFVSLFGSGMNFAGVSWYILAATHSTVKVSGQVIVMTLPGLVVPFLGGVLIESTGATSAFFSTWYAPSSFSPRRTSRGAAICSSGISMP